MNQQLAPPNKDLLKLEQNEIKQKQEYLQPVPSLSYIPPVVQDDSFLKKQQQIDANKPDSHINSSILDGPQVNRSSLEDLQNPKPLNYDSFRKKKRNMVKQRKIRTVITKAKLLQMNKIFSEYIQNKSLSISNNQYMNLKEIADLLGLGYSTILHKFREFRANKKVKAGMLISVTQMKRKYRKSLKVQEMITKVMGQRDFYTATEMTEYIESNYGIKFSRSIISRHLGEMGYSYKNVSKHQQYNSSQSKYDQLKKIYSYIILPLIQAKQTFIFIDELCCSFVSPNSLAFQTITILIACTAHGVLYFHIQEGFFTRLRFKQILKQFVVNLKSSSVYEIIHGRKDELHIVLDMNNIHRDNNEGQPGIADMSIDENIQLYYIPPCSPNLNPIEHIFSKIKQRISVKIEQKEIVNFKQMWSYIEEIMQQMQHQSTQDYFEEMYSQLQRYYYQKNQKNQVN